LLGVTHNVPFLVDVLSHPDFLAGHVHTTWVEDHFDGWQPPQCDLPAEVLVAAGLAMAQSSTSGPISDPGAQGRDPYSPWHYANNDRGRRKV
jgi:acetyl/propionyl-CoA carboxylase alpha subunit